MSSHPSLAGARPLFLIGPPRSGTTLMARILNAHRQILLTNETAIFMQVAENVRRSEIGRKEGILFGKSHGEMWADVLRSHAHDLFDDFYTRLAATEGRKTLAFCGEKHPHLDMALDFIANLYPNAVYIYAIRDPRDSACSIAEMNDRPFKKALETWGRFSQHYETFADARPAEQVIRLRYEDLIQDYEGVARSLVQQLGLAPDEGLIRYVREFARVDSHTSVAARASATDDVRPAAKARVTRDFGATSLHRWRTELGPEDRARAVDEHGAFLERYGYERN